MFCSNEASDPYDNGDRRKKNKDQQKIRMDKISMAEFQEKVDALGNEVAHWEKELQALREIVAKTRQIREELHKGGLGEPWLRRRSSM